MKAIQRLKIDLLARPESLGMVLYGLQDVLSLTGSSYDIAMRQPVSAARTEVRIVGPSVEPFTCRGGTPVQPVLAYDGADGADLVIVANVSFPMDESPLGRFAAEAAWLRRQYENGAALASVCTGAILLAETGLLAGHEATTHWGYADFVRGHYPDVDWRTERIMTASGEGGRLIMAGGAGSWQDLALYLIARFIDPREAMRTAKSLILSDHAEGQAAYASMPQHPAKGDMAIVECQEWLANNYAAPDAIRSLVVTSGLSQRTLGRRFLSATGYRPLEYLQTLRVEEAKQLLEVTSLSIDEIANSVGYSDPRSFQRLFSRKVGISAAEYRRKFKHTRFAEMLRG